MVDFLPDAHYILLEANLPPARQIHRVFFSHSCLVNQSHTYMSATHTHACLFMACMIFAIPAAFSFFILPFLFTQSPGLYTVGNAPSARLRLDLAQARAEIRG